jgi:hypothetical protein
MIYLPIELQLQIIREELNYIKSHICNHYPIAVAAAGTEVIP